MTAVDLDALDKLRGALARKLTTWVIGVAHENAWNCADVLVPVIEQFANERAAAELRAAAWNIRRTTVLGHIAERLDVRADALDPP